jgi:hypothetical protein
VLLKFDVGLHACGGVFLLEDILAWISFDVWIIIVNQGK